MRRRGLFWRRLFWRWLFWRWLFWRWLFWRWWIRRRLSPGGLAKAIFHRRYLLLAIADGVGESRKGRVVGGFEPRPRAINGVAQRLRRPIDQLPGSKDLEPQLAFVEGVVRRAPGAIEFGSQLVPDRHALLERDGWASVRRERRAIHHLRQ